MFGKSATSICGPSAPSIFCRQCLSRKLPPPGKPPILPPAKSRLYNVPQSRWQNPGDTADLLWRRHIYNSAIMSMRRVFREEIGLKKGFAVGFEETKRAEAEELDTLLALNEQRNCKLGEARVEREKVAMEQLEQETLEEIERRLDWKQQNAEKRTREVLDAIERSKTEFVSRENLEKCILEALEKPTTFEYAIDLNGIKIPNPVPESYPPSVAMLPNIYEKPLDYGPPIDGYKYKKGRMGPPKTKGPRNQTTGGYKNREKKEVVAKVMG